MTPKHTPPATVPASPVPTWAAYIRVSSKTQANHKYRGTADLPEGTHEAQRETLSAWAKATGTQVEFYCDPGVTGKDGINIAGPVFQQMLTDLATRPELCGVVTTATDRLGRETLSKLLLYRQLKSLGKRLYSTKPGQGEIDLSDEQAFVREIVTAADSEARRRLVDGLQNGARRWREAGGRPGREPKAVNWKDAKLLLDAGASVRVVANAFGLSRAQFWRRMKAQGVTNPNFRPFGKPKPAPPLAP